MTGRPLETLTPSDTAVLRKLVRRRDGCRTRLEDSERELSETAGAMVAEGSSPAAVARALGITRQGLAHRLSRL